MTLYFIRLEYDKKRGLILSHIKLQTECTLDFSLDTFKISGEYSVTNQFCQNRIRVIKLVLLSETLVCIQSTLNQNSTSGGP